MAVNDDCERKIFGENACRDEGVTAPRDFFSTKAKIEPKPSLVMKPIIPFALLGALLTVGAVNAASTDPVGYITIPLPGTTGGAGTQKLQIASPGLLPSDALQFAGAAESFGTDGTGTYLQDDQGTWAAGAYVNGTRVSHLIEITSGTLQGSTTWIKSSVANKLYTEDNLSAAGAGATYKVLKTFTIASLLGDVPTASVLGGGANLTAADNFQILDPVTNTYTTFWYKSSGVGGTGWRSPSITDTVGTIVASTAIYPNDGLIFLRKQSTAGSLVVTGSVKPGQSKVVVEGKTTTTVLNIVATEVPVDQLTFGTSGLYTGDATTGLKGGANATAADNVLIFDATTNSYTTYYYKNAGVGGTGWRTAAGVDATAVVIAGTSAPLIQRKSGVSFTWTIPAVSIAP